MKASSDCIEGPDPVHAAKLVEDVVGIAWATDPNGAFLYSTSGAPVFRGLSIPDLNAAGAGWSRLLHADDVEDAALLWRQALGDGNSYSVDCRMLAATGNYAWVRISGRSLLDDHGKVAGWYGSIVGATASTLSARADQGMPDMRMVHPDDRSAVTQASARAFFHGVPQISSYRTLQPDGSYRWTELRLNSEHQVSVDPGIAIAMKNDAWTVAEEFGETVEAVHAARLLENLYGGAWALDARGRFTYATPTAQTSIGMTLEDLNRPLGGKEFIAGGEHGWKRTVHPDDYENMSSVFRDGLVRGEAWNVEYRVLRANGDYVWHRVGARPTFGDEGRVTGWYGISLDIDVYKKTEAALREREQQLQQLIDAVPAQVWSLTPSGRPSYINRQLADVVGVELADLVGPEDTRSHIDVHPDHREPVETAIARSLKTGEPFMMRYRQRRFDGTFRWVESRAEPLRDNDGEIIQWYGVCFDVENEMRASEDLRTAQDRLARASQAASLAELSASIAHEVNQPLTAVMTNAQACRRWMAADPPRLDRAQLTVERIIRDTNVAAEVVKRTRELFKQAIPRQSVSLIEPVIAEAARLLADFATSRGIEIQIDIREPLPSIAADHVQLQQVLINLMRNGIEAMESETAGNTLLVRAMQLGDLVQVDVVDEGVGLSDPNCVFDAFFTTKERGLGMGLAISRSIIETQGGRLWAESAGVKGAKFTFVLALGQQAPDDAPAQ